MDIVKRTHSPSIYLANAAPNLLSALMAIFILYKPKVLPLVLTVFLSMD